MEISGHVQNGMVIPDAALPMPEGAKVVIVLPPAVSSGDELSGDEMTRQRNAFARIDAVANENPGDEFTGADHDRVLYGDGQ